MAGITNIVQGKNCLFQVDVGFGYKTLVCAKSFSVTIETDMVETTTVGTGNVKAFDYDILSYTISLAGLMKIVDADGDAIFLDLENYQRNFLELQYKAIFTAPNGIVKIFKGIAIVARSIFNAAPAQLADSSIDLQGSGQYEVLDADSASCDTVITNLTFTQEAPGSPVQVFVTETGTSVGRWEYSINGGSRVPKFTNPFFIALGAGLKNFKVWPVCDSGFDGTPRDEDYTVV